MLNEHGNYSLCHEEQIIFLKAFGPWNEISSTACINEINFMVNTMQYDEFAIIADTSKLDGMTLESFDLWFKALDFYFENGHKHFIRIDKDTRIEYTLFSLPFDKVIKERMPCMISDSFSLGIEILHLHGYKGFDKNVENEDCIKNF